MHSAGRLKQNPEERYGRFGDGFKRAVALDTPAAALAGAAADKRQPAAGGGRRGPEAQPKGRRAPVPRQYCFAYARLPRVSASSIWHKRHKREQPHYTYDRLFMKKDGPAPVRFFMYFCKCGYKTGYIPFRGHKKHKTKIRSWRKKCRKKSLFPAGLKDRSFPAAKSPLFILGNRIIFI